MLILFCSYINVTYMCVYVVREDNGGCWSDGGVCGRQGKWTGMIHCGDPQREQPKEEDKSALVSSVDSQKGTITIPRYSGTSL